MVIMIEVQVIVVVAVFWGQGQKDIYDTFRHIFQLEQYASKRFSYPVL
jgi:hypothetical protein